MAEPEDLIIDGAYIASRLARDVWRRYAPAPPERVLRLADVRVRLELFLNALFESPIHVSAAEPPPPVSWLARLAGRGAESRVAAMAGTDGVRIFLPDALDAPDGIEDSLQRYLLLAVEQAVRLARGGTSLALGIDDNEVRDWFLIAEAAAVDDWIAHHAAGLIPTLRAARLEALTQRTGASSRDDRVRAIESCVRAFLAHDPQERVEHVPLFATSAEALEWARKTAHTGRDGYRGMPGVWSWGRAFRAALGLAGATPVRQRHAGCGTRAAPPCR